jgi:hypothetical protein
MTDIYQVGQPKKPKKKRTIFWLVFFIVLVGISAVGVQKALNLLKPHTTIAQAKPTTTHVSYSSKLKHYDVGDFSLDLPNTWTAIPRPPGPYKSFSWRSPDKVTDGQEMEIFEDVIPKNFAANRVLIIAGQNDRLSQQGIASDNCTKYTIGPITTGGYVGTLAKWQGVEFLCDQANSERDTIGTSSTDGINTVTLKSQSSPATHQFFFTYTNDNATNPDYSTFYNAISSFRMN